MREPTALSLSKLLSELTDRHVSFTLAPNAVLKSSANFFAVYSELPNDALIVARLEKPAVAVLGGALLGMPEDTAIERAGALPKDVPIWDAMNEILNITSSALSTQGRVVYKEVFPDSQTLSSAAQQILLRPSSIATYSLAISEKPRGLFTLFS